MNSYLGRYHIATKMYRMRDVDCTYQTLVSPAAYVSKVAYLKKFITSLKPLQTL